MKFHSDDIRKYKTALDNLLVEVNKAKERVLKLPQLDLSNLTAEDSELGRDELTQLFKNAILGVKNQNFDALEPWEKWELINSNIQLLSSTGKIAATGGFKNPAKFLATIMILETFSRLFRNFNPQTAGFANEGALASLYGGQLKQAAAANSVGNIADVEDASGNAISIKTRVDSSVDGSLDNLIHTINTNNNRRVFFDIYNKGNQSANVSSFTYIRFEVNKENLNSFLSYTGNEAGQKIQKVLGRINESVETKKDFKKFEIQFNIPMSHWKKLNNATEPINVNFDADLINKISTEVLANLNDSIVDIFNKLDIFSDKIGKYFTSISSNRLRDFGTPALTAAREIQSSTEEVITKK